MYSIASNGQLGSPTILTVGNTTDGGGILVSQKDGRIYIAETADNQVLVLNGDLSLNSILSTGLQPYALAENPTLGVIYLGDRGSDVVVPVGE